MPSKKPNLPMIVRPKRAPRPTRPNDGRARPLMPSDFVRSEPPRWPRLPVEPPSAKPIHLTASVTLAPGQQASPNVRALINPSGGPMMIDEIKFEIGAARLVAGALVSCKLALGKIPLTSDFVPIYNFMRCDYPNAEEHQVGETAESGVAGYGQFTWRLAKPLYVPATGIVIPIFKHSDFLNTTITVRISYSCRILPTGTPLPSTIYVPFVAGWTGIPATADASTTTTDSSPENALANPFDVPLHVERITGRLGLFRPSNSLVVESALVVYETETDDDVCMVKMRASSGDPVVMQATPFRHVFSGPLRSMELPHVMPPGSFYVVDTSFLAANALTNAYAVPSVAIVGWREVRSF